ncbi:MAG TPA: M36 family metallopeptidase [Hymenobacter sp.]|uniref:M36 family metallopeptidase n=1 Tax=Hymenobacter sp. TaxID=1898978 RepID=UPI002D7FFFDE|nr:M36 family metallopeptidase [Hymenobacter sp.]HET9503662.1 M36 family metallopeptidase [Hymenobacter sp.]
MKKSFTRKLSLAVLGLLPLAALHAQTLDPALALEKAQATRAQWAGPGFTAAEARLSSAYADANGLEHVYMQQLYRGIPVYNHMQSLAFKGSRLALHTGSFVPAKQLADLAATPGLTAAAAVSRALLHVRGTDTGTPKRLTAEGGPEARQTFDKADIAHHDIVASLTWAFDKDQRPHLTWNVNVDLVDSPDWWNVRVDAQTGAIVDKDNWTTHETLPHAAEAPAAAPTQGYQAMSALLALAPPPPTTATASYLVVPFPLERPSTAAGNGFVTDTDPWLRAGASNNAVTHGWHFDGTTNYTTTRGNNVSAYDDGASTNNPGTYATSQTGSPTLTFNYPADFTQNAATTANRNAATTNLFYWNNIIHDVTYQYGFTEAAGNFQADNLGRGGIGNDYVRAEAQDGGGSNNANFSTPVDGSSGRMQMYLWNPSTPAYSLTVTAPTAVAGSYTAVEGRISANNRLSSVGPVSGELALYTDAGATTSLACASYGGTTPLTGKIALLYRGGTCSFPTKVKNAQLAGAIGVIVVNNVTTNPITMPGTDNTITIPAVMVSQATGATLAAQVANAVQVTLPVNANTIQRDGDFDNGVMVHEYGHGVSTRLTGGPANSSCLGNAEQGGEGWSDYLSLMLNTNWATAQLTDGPNARPIGTFASGQAPTGGGIRRYPYSTSMTTNPLTYANVASSVIPHGVGEIWCATLWDMTWNIIQQKAFIQPNIYNTTADPGGNVIALQLMMQGLKLQPCQPGFLDARDAILAADSLLYNGAYHCAIWRAFARRGMGYNAVQGLSTSTTDQVANFDLPPTVILDQQEALRTGNSFTMSFRLSCGCPPATPTAPYTLTAELPTGLQFISSNSGGTLVGNKVTFSNLNFTTPGQTATVSYVAQATAAAACPIVTPVNDNRDNVLVGGFASQKLLGNTNWTTSTTRAYSPTTSWYAAEPAVDSDFMLTSTLFTPTGLSMLSFYHYFNFEGGYDGGTVELSTDNGTTWLDATSYFVQNGYNSTFAAGTLAPGLRCFSGLSDKTPGTFMRSLLDLRSFAGQPLLVRFRVRTDTGNSTAVEGWYIDNIQVLNGCGGPQLIELRTGAGTLQTAQPIFTYLLPSGALATQAGTLAAASQFLAHPNPFGSAGLQVQLTLPTAQAKLGLTLLDVTGRTLLRRSVAQAAAGTSTLSWPETASLPAGLYLLQVQLPDGSTTTLRVEHE